ncbi:MAG TPA: hypothetical protein VGF14_08185 [Alphaproteobacteria bacterium]
MSQKTSLFFQSNDAYLNNAEIVSDIQRRVAERRYTTMQVKSVQDYAAGHSVEQKDVTICGWLDNFAEIEMPPVLAEQILALDPEQIKDKFPTTARICRAEDIQHPAMTGLGFWNI